MAQRQKEWQQKQQSMQAQISGIEQSVCEASIRRKRIAAQVTGDLITRYELIFARRGGTAVVEVTGGICQGCYMNIPPQIAEEILVAKAPGPMAADPADLHWTKLRRGTRLKPNGPAF